MGGTAGGGRRKGAAGDSSPLLYLSALPPAGVDVSVFSSLYETAPAYVTDQARVKLRRGRASAR
jgi:hypothetical protein